MAAFLIDLFSEASVNEALENHTPDTGGAWSKLTGFTGNLQIYATTDRLLHAGTAAAIYVNAATPASADYTVRGKVVRLSSLSNALIGVIGRCDTTTAFHYLARVDSNSGVFELMRKTGASHTSLGTYSLGAALTLSQVYQLELDMVGTTIRLLVDGVEQISVTDANITAAGKAGCYATNGSAASLTNGIQNEEIRAGTSLDGDVTPPTVASATPASGATAVAASVSPTVTFSEALAAGTVTTSTVRVLVAGSPVAAAVTLDAPSFTATVNPTSDFPASTLCTIEVTTGVTDSAGNALASTFTQSFTTAAGGGAGSTLGYDYFAGTDGVALSSRLSASGHAWTQEAGGFTIQSNRAVWGGFTGARAIMALDPPAAEYDIYAEVYPTAVSGSPSVYARWAGSTGYRFLFNYTLGRVELYGAGGSLIVNGTSGLFAGVVGQVLTFKVEVRDATKKVFVGVGPLSGSPSFTEIFSSANNAITQVGRAGIFTNSAAGLTFETFILGESGFTFVADTTPPTVTRGSVAAYGGQTAALADIVATANKGAQFRVRWGTATGVYTGGTTAYGAAVASGQAATTRVTGLPGGSTIFYVVDALDPSGNLGTSSEGSFAAPANDNTAPTIGAIVVTPATDGSSLTFAFTTSEGANATVDVGTVSGTYPLSASDTGYPTSHSLVVTGTQSGRTYFYRVVAVDPATNTTTTAQASYTSAGVNGAGLSRVNLSRGTKTLLAEVWFNADDNANIATTTRYKKTGEANQTWTTGDPTGWRVGVPLMRQGEYDAYGRMLVGFFANLDHNTSYDLEITITDADGLSAASPTPLYVNEVATGNASLATTNGTTKVLTATVSTKSATLAAPGAATLYLAPSGNDTTGDGSVGTPWQTLNKAATAAPTGAIVQLAAGSYAPLTGARALPITFKAATLATSLGDVTESGRTMARPAAANAGSRAVIEGQLLYTPTGSGLPNAGLWTSVNLVGPATGVSRAVWKLTGVPSTVPGPFAYADTATADSQWVSSWARKTNSFTPPAGTPTGQPYTMTTAAGWREVVAVNWEYRYGWTTFPGTLTGTVDVYAVVPAGVDLNTKYCRFGLGGDANQVQIAGPDIRFHGVEFRQVDVQIRTGGTNTILDRCLFSHCVPRMLGNKSVVPNTRPADTWIVECVGRTNAHYSADPANKFLLANWNWVKSTTVIDGSGATGWQRVGGNQETHALDVQGGSRRATIRNNSFSGFFNGLSCFNVGFDRFCMYHFELHDNWFEEICDDPIEPESVLVGLLCWDNVIRNTATHVSMSPANCGPMLVKGHLQYGLTKEGYGTSCGPAGDGNGLTYPPSGVALFEVKFGLNHWFPPNVYWWQNTGITVQSYVNGSGNGIGRANNGSVGQVRPTFRIRNSIVRTTRYASEWDSACDEDYNDFSTPDLSRGIVVGGSNKITIAAYRASMTDPSGDHTNTRADFHTLVDGEFFDLAGGDLRLIAGSALIGAGTPLPYWERPGIDFAGVAPNIGAWQTTGSPPADVTAPTVVATAPASGATQVPVSASPTVTFSEAMDAATITTSTVRVKLAGTPVAAVVTYDAPSRTATVNPDSNLANATAYTIDVEVGAEDAAGNALAAAFAVSFTTVAASDVTAPTILSATPASNAVGIGVNALVNITVSEPLATGTVTTTTVRLLDGATPVAGAVGYTAGGTLVTFNPTADLANNTIYTIQVTTGLTDVAGNPLAVTFTQSFTTVAANEPTFSNPVAEPLVAVRVTWTSLDATTTQLEYGPTLALGALTTLDPALATDHEAFIYDLVPGAHLYVRAIDGVGESEIARLTVPGRRRGGLLKL